MSRPDDGLKSQPKATPLQVNGSYSDPIRVKTSLSSLSR
jgi:hypothetical protein